jgi:coenzyme PQQ precursor peptide PqqA
MIIAVPPAKRPSSCIAEERLFSERRKIMEWTAPKFEEIALNCEINSYASAAL